MLFLRKVAIEVEMPNFLRPHLDRKSLKNLVVCERIMIFNRIKVLINSKVEPIRGHGVANKSLAVAPCNISFEITLILYAMFERELWDPNS